MQKKLYLMQESELKAFFDCSKELREAAFKMPADDVKSHTAEILELAQINEIVEGEKLNLEVDIDGIAHIPIQGMLTNHVSPSAGFFGESITTYEFLSEATAQAEAIDQVKEIVFEIASGGGEVDGLEAVANAIFNSKKPTTARIHGLAASAAFWLASQTDKIVTTGRTSSVGSIGVAAEFIDRSAQDKASGIKRVILTSTDAPKKRLDIKTAAGQQQTINRLDEIHTVFVDHIVRGISARNKNITSDFVNKNFGRGSVMAADAALAVGMIDEIEGVTDTLTTGEDGSDITAVQNHNSGVNSTDNTGNTSGNSNQKGKMDEKQFLAFLETNPEAKEYFSTVVADHKKVVASHETAITTMKTDHDQAIETAKTEASTAIEKDAVSVADATKATKLIATGKYPECTDYAANCFAGSGDFAVLTSMIAQSDQMQTKFDLMQVKLNKEKGLKAENHGDLEANTSLESPAIAADIKDLQAKMGVN